MKTTLSRRSGKSTNLVYERYHDHMHAMTIFTYVSAINPMFFIGMLKQVIDTLSLAHTSLYT